MTGVCLATRESSPSTELLGTLKISPYDRVYATEAELYRETEASCIHRGSLGFTEPPALEVTQTLSFALPTVRVQNLYH